MFPGRDYKCNDPKWFDCPIMQQILQDPLVKFSVGCHPKQANKYNDNLGQTIKSYMVHLKINGTRGDVTRQCDWGKNRDKRQ